MPPRRRLGPGGAAQPPPPPGHVSGANPNPGRRRLGSGPTPPTPPTAPTAPAPQGPFRSRYEQAMFGPSHAAAEAAAAAEVARRAVLDRAAEEEQRIRDVIDRAAERLGGAKGRAIRRAFSGDDSLLLPIRPTNTSNPPRPRTLAAGWDPSSRTLFVRFRGSPRGGGEYADGAGYEYEGVSRREWREFRDGPSPGRMINAKLNAKPYRPASW